ncbi:bacterio-opsin activator domain-containing protein [Natronorubrum texcoconense]|uniref:PAS domain S-box-containing protein n=1 Tax=Natronorubrum texcoconense TaxID=1095776 RepID=A0A1G8XR20_9EURY|nr:bacterio-opsin activator domain-containing protein [Natronorubrum texcoconense]SDJ92907.1 hypothetical protein SAMN04515672_1865 [Natronorubrum texcoconense]
MSLEEPDSATLSRSQYESLLDAAETYREALVVRLCGDVGLRPTELTELTVDDVEQVRIDPPRYLVRVPAVDDGSGRTAYLPTHVERELRRYARSNRLSTDDRIFPVTARRLQMLVSEVADRAAEFLDQPTLADVSTSDLRQYFARTALVDHAVNPRVVKTVGGWRSFEALEPYLPEPTDAEIVDAFDAAERPSGPGRGGSGARTGPMVSDDSVIRLLLAASDRYALLRLDADGYVERWNRSAAAMFGYRAGEIVGTHVSTFYTDEAVDDGVPERTLAAALEDSGTETDGWRIHEDGTRFRATEVVSPLRDEQGRHRGFAVFVRDASAVREEIESVRARRDELEDRYAVATAHRAVTRSLFESTDHEEIETDTCAALADGRAYECAWIDRATHSNQRGEWRVSSGIDPDAVTHLVPDRWRETSATTADLVGERTSDESEATVSVATDVSLTTDRDDSSESSDESGALARVPLVYGDTVYGTLSVVSERDGAFDADERQWLETIGQQVGYAIAAVRRRNLLLSDRVVELELTCRDEDSFFVDASRRLGCRFELDSLVPLGETTQLYYLRLEGASPADVFDLAADEPGIEDCRLIETYEGGWRVEFVIDGSCPIVTLIEYGTTVLDARFEGGTATITTECAADADLRTIVDGLRAVFPDSELVGKREVERTVQTAREFQKGLEERLTDRQEAALRAAYFGGYYDWPRESTAEEIADAMGISSPTLHNHLRKGQHELLRTFFDDPDDGGSDNAT